MDTTIQMGTRFHLELTNIGVRTLLSMAHSTGFVVISLCLLSHPTMVMETVDAEHEVHVLGRRP